MGSAAIRIIRINSDHACTVENNGVGRLARSRSIIRRVIEENRLACRRTRGRPGGGFVAETLNVGPSIHLSCVRTGFVCNSILLVYASKLSGYIAAKSVIGVYRRGHNRNLVAGLISGTGSNKNSSGVATAMVCWK